MPQILNAQSIKILLIRIFPKRNESFLVASTLISPLRVEMTSTERIKKLIEILREGGLTGAILRSQANVFYFTGYRGSGALFIPTDGLPTLYVPPLDFELAEEMAAEEVQVIKLEQHSTIQSIFESIPEHSRARLGFDSLSAEDYLKISERLAGSMTPISDRIWKLRMIKDESEIDRIKRACEISSRCMELASEIIGQGVAESEIKAEILKEMLNLGGEKPAFDIIVASGPNSSKPHGSPGNRLIRSGDVVVIDIGAVYEGYCSDMTRTFYVGSEPSEEVEKAHQAVLDAKQKAEEFLKIGATASDLYQSAYDQLASTGYGEHFIHGLGHGVGIEIHEPPRISRNVGEVLSEGMVLTIEPGVYFPKRFGVRVEDTILVRREGVERLTRAPYELSLD